MKIVQRQLVNVRIADLKFDPSNPNEMTQEQMHALRRSMERFGYLTPIIVDQHNQIADGEHRVLVYKEFGLDEIPAFVVEFADDTERRMLRQTMNKLHGAHEPVKDLQELQTLFEAQKLDDLAELIAKPAEELQKMLAQQGEDLEKALGEGGEGGPYVITFRLQTHEQYEHVVSTIKAHAGPENNGSMENGLLRALGYRDEQ